MLNLRAWKIRRKLRADAIEQLRASLEEAVARFDTRSVEIPPDSVERQDRLSIKLDDSTTVYHPNGWVDVWGVATRVGVLMYEEQGQPWPELRPREEVLSPKSLGTLRGVPFTIDHPRDLVDSANARDLTHGWVMEVEARGDEIWVLLRIVSDEAKAEIDAGTVELSCGYTCVVVQGEGRWETGELYRSTQTQIRYNHLALVLRARAGAVARLHLDGTGSKMNPAKITIKGKTTKVDSAAALAHLALLVPGLTEVADQLEADRAKGKRADMATAELMISMEGDEPTKLILPQEMVEGMLSMLGMGATPTPEAPSPTPAPEGMGEEDTKIPGVGEDEEEEEDPAAPKMDAAGLAKTIDAAVAKALATAKADEARSKTIDAEAKQVLGEKYDAEAPTVAKQVAVIVSQFDGMADDAADLAKATVKGDAAGAASRKALDALYAAAIKQHQAKADAKNGQDLAGAFGADKSGDVDKSDSASPSDQARERMKARQDALSRGEDPDKATDTNAKKK